jgi:HSP20 family protein
MAESLVTRRHTSPSLYREPRRGMLGEMEDLMGRLWDGGQDGWFTGGYVPSLDISETDTTVEAKLDLPGVKPEETEIQLNGNVLTVSGKRKEEQEEKGKTYHCVERRIGTFSRSMTLPCPSRCCRSMPLTGPERTLSPT